MNSTDKLLAGLGLIGLGIIIAIFVPLAHIWAWNQLFGSFYIIGYTFWNWLAVLVLGMFFRSVSFRKNA